MTVVGRKTASCSQSAIPNPSSLILHPSSLPSDALDHDGHGAIRRADLPAVVRSPARRGIAGHATAAQPSREGRRAGQRDARHCPRARHADLRPGKHQRAGGPAALDRHRGRSAGGLRLRPNPRPRDACHGPPGRNQSPRFAVAEVSRRGAHQLGLAQRRHGDGRYRDPHDAEGRCRPLHRPGGHDDRSGGNGRRVGSKARRIGRLAGAADDRRPGRGPSGGLAAESGPGLARRRG